LTWAGRVEKVTRFFYASSACIYPEGEQLTTDLSAGLKEASAWPAQPQDAYGLEKLASEEVGGVHVHFLLLLLLNLLRLHLLFLQLFCSIVCLHAITRPPPHQTQYAFKWLYCEVYKHYQSDFGIQTRIGRFHNIYGPFGTWKVRLAHVLPSGSSPPPLRPGVLQISGCCSSWRSFVSGSCVSDSSGSASCVSAGSCQLCCMFNPPHMILLNMYIYEAHTSL
jgi:hypothetical protein